MRLFNLPAALVAVSLVAPGVVAAAEPEAQRHCFFSSQFENWKAADEKTIFIRVGVNRYFRLDLAGGCRSAAWPDSFLITKFRGSNTVCSAIDWDLKVSQPHGIAEACIVSQMTELTPAEVDAIPKKAKP
jgi:hypothetical protein